MVSLSVAFSRGGGEACAGGTGELDVGEGRDALGGGGRVMPVSGSGKDLLS